MNAIIIKKDLNFVDFSMRKKDIFIFNRVKTAQFLSVLKDKNSAVVKNIEDVFKRYPADPDKKNIFVIRSGGIGDLLALSSVAFFLSEYQNKNVIFITQGKYSPLFKWFKAPVSFQSWQVPIAKNSIKFQLNTNISQLNYEGKIEGANENWFDIFYEGIETNGFYFGRPYLEFPEVSNFTNSNIRFDEGILLTLKASANIRSIQFEPVYTALIESSIDVDKLFVHRSNLSELDTQFITKIKDNRVTIIEAENLDCFLDDVANARFVISTDTGALHFREGLKRKAIGLFAPFSAECRTKYYKYTHSYNLTSNCKHQPCFKHCRRPEDKCKGFIDNVNYPPCTDINHNNTIINQLIEIFNKPI